ncbi:hypothetical protein C7C46_06580 [Streptomyces tateyamensis]|uniref:Uncharacterized protein n=1 Tax=Streptomyces tateyamensis TaxID=565073 RepID=A0A2V4P5W9_9ACTN|nr:hypothetical protein [Streptomyces tateyamensis]PYC85402.1 hypothetical protein C7C46_06580 [Streptomyces tateyamensis]
MRLRDAATRLDMWWHLHGQFSWPVRMVWPSRRRVYAQVGEWLAEPGYQRASLERVTARVAERQALHERLAAELDQMPLPSEAELFERIFGRPPADL